MANLSPLAPDADVANFDFSDLALPLKEKTLSVRPIERCELEDRIDIAKFANNEMQLSVNHSERERCILAMVALNRLHGAFTSIGDYESANIVGQMWESTKAMMIGYQEKENIKAAKDRNFFQCGPKTIKTGPEKDLSEEEIKIFHNNNSLDTILYELKQQLLSRGYYFNFDRHPIFSHNQDVIYPISAEGKVSIGDIGYSVNFAQGYKGGTGLPWGDSLIVGPDEVKIEGFTHSTSIKTVIAHELAHLWLIKQLGVQSTNQWRSFPEGTRAGDFQSCNNGSLSDLQVSLQQVKIGDNLDVHETIAYGKSNQDGGHGSALINIAFNDGLRSRYDEDEITLSSYTTIANITLAVMEDIDRKSGQLGLIETEAELRHSWKAVKAAKDQFDTMDCQLKRFREILKNFGFAVDNIFVDELAERIVVEIAHAQDPAVLSHLDCQIRQLEQPYTDFYLQMLELTGSPEGFRDLLSDQKQQQVTSEYQSLANNHQDLVQEHILRCANIMAEPENAALLSKVFSEIGYGMIKTIEDGNRMRQKR